MPPAVIWSAMFTSRTPASCRQFMGLLADRDVDWADQVMALGEDGYAGCVAMEPHLWPSVASVKTLSRFNALKNN